MDAPGVADRVEDFEREFPPGGQFLPPAGDEREAGMDAAMRDDPVERLRDDLSRLADRVAALDGRDAAQHGALKGEMAHLVRRIARLEAIPRPRPAR